jgi:hypothetical protein
LPHSSLIAPTTRMRMAMAFIVQGDFNCEFPPYAGTLTSQVALESSLTRCTTRSPRVATTFRFPSTQSHPHRRMNPSS